MHPNGTLDQKEREMGTILKIPFSVFTCDQNHFNEKSGFLCHTVFSGR